MTSIERVEGMDVHEFMRLYDEEGPFELLEGERIPLSPTVRAQSLITRTVFCALDAHCSKNKLGEVFSETTFVIFASTDWVNGSRQPDVLFISADRFAEAIKPEGAEKPFVFIPNLVVEIVSPTDKLADVLKKVSLYLNDGVQIVWMVNRKRQTVTVYRRDTNDSIILTIKDTLDGGDVIPGFSLPVAALFAEG